MCIKKAGRHKMGVKVEFLEKVPSGDPSERPCTILGKKTNLQSVPFEKVSSYLGSKVTEEVYIFSTSSGITFFSLCIQSSLSSSF